MVYLVPSTFYPRPSTNSYTHWNAYIKLQTIQLILIPEKLLLPQKTQPMEQHLTTELLAEAIQWLGMGRVELLVSQIWFGGKTFTILLHWGKCVLDYMLAECNLFSKGQPRRKNKLQIRYSCTLHLSARKILLDRNQY